MKKDLASLQALALTTFLALLASVDAAQAVDPDPAVKMTFDKMIGAIQSNDLKKFVADGTQAVKNATTQEIMDALNKQLGARMKDGYEASYLGFLRQEGYQSHLWKLSFKDQKDDVLVRLVLKNKKVGGFFLQ